MAAFFGASVITEQDEFARTFAAFGFRLFGVVSLVFFVVGYIRRCFENRDIDYLLSRPIGRISFILTHASAFWWACVYLVLGCTVFAFVAQNWALRHSTPTRVSVLTSSEPAFGALFAVFWLGESLSATAWAGGALIVVAALWSMAVRTGSQR